MTGPSRNYAAVREQSREVGESSVVRRLGGAVRVSASTAFDTVRTLDVGGRTFRFHALAALPGSEDLPLSLRLLLENVIRVR